MRKYINSVEELKDAMSFRVVYWCGASGPVSVVQIKMIGNKLIAIRLNGHNNFIPIGTGGFNFFSLPKTWDLQEYLSLEKTGQSYLTKFAQSNILTEINDKGQKVLQAPQEIVSYEIVENKEPTLMLTIGGEQVLESTLCNVQEYKIGNMSHLRYFSVNCQTAMIIDEKKSIIYAVANLHTKIMVYNKPNISIDELGTCREMFLKRNFLIEDEISTDSFGIEFWNDQKQKTTPFTTDLLQ